jgi:hemin uptake protein HemP
VSAPTDGAGAGRPGEPGSTERGRPTPVSAGRRRIESDVLFEGRREVVIVHTGKEYVLRITRQGKLILTA